MSDIEPKISRIIESQHESERNLALKDRIADLERENEMLKRGTTMSCEACNGMAKELKAKDDEIAKLKDDIKELDKCGCICCQDARDTYHFTMKGAIELKEENARLQEEKKHYLAMYKDAEAELTRLRSLLKKCEEWIGKVDDECYACDQAQFFDAANLLDEIRGCK